MRIPVLKSLADPHLLVFSSFPDFADNTYAFYLFLENNRYWEKFKLVWLVEKVTESIRVRVKENHFHCKVIKKKSILGVFAFMRCRHFFSSHGGFRLFDTSAVPEKHVSLWHGMPLKRIGRLLYDDYDFKPNLTIASSTAFQKIMSDCFDLSIEKVLVTGQPRCDMMSNKTEFFKNRGIELTDYSKVGIWMPTFRVSIAGDIRQDGSYQEGNVSFLTKENIMQLDNYLRKKNVLLILKIHPMDVLQNYIFPDYSNIVVIKPHEADSELYPILGNCDFLLTDYSSVYIDYEVLSRPIGFVMDDLDEYSTNRGFCFEHIEDVMPGRLLTNLEEMEDFIDKPEVESCSVRLNEYHDFNSSKRLADYLML